MKVTKEIEKSFFIGDYCPFKYGGGCHALDRPMLDIMCGWCKYNSNKEEEEKESEEN